MSWPEIVGHAAVWERLMRLLGADHLPHAMLFSGPPGVGKALLARRLAARLVCTAAAAAPCGECAGCRQAAAGSHPDVLVLTAPDRAKSDTRKREIGIDQARALKRFAQLQPVAAHRKVALIDDADRLSVAAQNALLKTLEEPPGPSVIMLITASPDALLPTVRSRCQLVLCRPLSEHEVRTVLVATGMSAEEAAGLAAVADGSPGRALGLRAGWQESDRREVERLLAELETARYGPVLAMSKGLGSSEAEMTRRFEGLLALCRDAAVTAAETGQRDQLERAMRRADATIEALRTLRWRNPNRALLGEALALRLARA